MRAIRDINATGGNKEQIIHQYIKMLLIYCRMINPFFMKENLPRSKANVANSIQRCATYLQRCNVRLQQAQSGAYEGIWKRFIFRQRVERFI
jgi:hypothetical protein